eukprot:UN04612
MDRKVYGYNNPLWTDKVYGYNNYQIFEIITNHKTFNLYILIFLFAQFLSSSFFLVF